MNSLQIGFILATFVVPVLCWLLVRRTPPGPIPRGGVDWFFAVVLVGAYGTATYLQAAGMRLRIDGHLPMQLCDWAAVATVIALLVRSQGAFELAYCWGLAGTFQALLTPAVAVDGGIRVWCFLMVHSSIPAAVIWLLLAGRRPSRAAWVHVAWWSQLYFVTAILVNWWSGANYGFLARRPERPSLLDKFPDPPGGWAYTLSVDAFAMLLFALMLLPWHARRRRNGGTAEPAGDLQR